MGHQVDAIVGRNVKIHRLQNGLSQAELGARVGVTFQQVQKYESGTNRIGASRMMQIAEVLGTSVQTLFEGAATSEPGGSGSPTELITDHHAMRLVKAFAQNQNRRVRLTVVELVESISSSRSICKPK